MPLCGIGPKFLQGTTLAAAKSSPAAARRPFR
jgi:hypothetical protein